MQSQTAFALRRIRRSAEVVDIHLAGRDAERVDAALAVLDADSAAFEALPATSPRDIALKASQAIRCLLDSGHESPADLLRTFFRTRKEIDGAWLHDLRVRVQAITYLAPDCDYALNCLQSILTGVGKPRLA